MEREILFRGKRLDNGEWVEGHLLSFKAGQINPDRSFILSFASSVSVSLGAYTFGGFVEVDPATVGQYTGLTDKNGKKIFEGDILEFINEWRELNNKWKCVVEFIDGCFVCRYIEKEGHLGDYNYFGSWNAPLVKWWVIGNKWDNPELLEVEK